MLLEDWKKLFFVKTTNKKRYGEVEVPPRQTEKSVTVCGERKIFSAKKVNDFYAIYYDRVRLAVCLCREIQVTDGRTCVESFKYIAPKYRMQNESA